MNSISTVISTRSNFGSDLLKVVGASILLGALAPLAIPLPFTPVPISLGPSLVILFGALLGSKRGAMTVLLYLFQGAMGLPVFAKGNSGLLTLAGPTGGYLLGYVVAAFVVGYLIERMKERRVTPVILTMALGNLIIFGFGLPWLSRFVGWDKAFTLGMAPFLPGDVVKLVLLTRLLKGLRFFSLSAK